MTVKVAGQPLVETVEPLTIPEIVDKAYCAAMDELTKHCPEEDVYEVKRRLANRVRDTASLRVANKLDWRRQR